MSFFNFKKKAKNLSGGITLKDLKKQAKKDKESLIVPIEMGKKGTKFFKIGDAVYAPVPNQNAKQPTFFKVANITFVSQEDTNGKAENHYNISIQYKKNGGNYFYSYNLCDDEIKSNVCSKLTDAVKIQIRNKEDLYTTNKFKLKQVKKQAPQNTLTDEELDELFFEPLKPKVNEARREFLTNSRKHIDTSKKFSREETLAMLRGIAEQRKRENQAQQGEKQEVPKREVVNRYVIRQGIVKKSGPKRVIFVDHSQEDLGRLKIKENAVPSRYDIPKSRYFDGIKSFQEASSKGKSSQKLTDAEVEELFFE